jgi:predicted transcriptional regulator
MSETQGIKLDEITKQRLKALGAMRDRSPHWLMKAAIERYLDEEEAYERQKHEDLAEWESYSLTGEAIPNSRVIEWLSQLAEGKRTQWEEQKE